MSDRCRVFSVVGRFLEHSRIYSFQNGEEDPLAVVYLALKHGMPYVRQSQEENEAQMKEKQIKALRRKARLLGLEIIEQTSGSVAPAEAASAQGERRGRGHPK